MCEGGRGLFGDLANLPRYEQDHFLHEIQSATGMAGLADQ